MKRFVASVVLLLGWYGSTPAQPSQAPKPVEVEITPRAIEEPILKYRLFPREDERKPGNAVPILLRLPWEQTQYMNKVFPELAKWDELPVSDPKWKTFQDLPGRFFEEMKRAAYRREAHWEYPIGESPAMLILLPDVQGLRGFLGYGLSAKAKSHLARGEWEETLDVVKVGMANGKHMAATPFAVNQLVSAAIQRSMLDRVTDAIALPGCPNLYWALSSLPASPLNLDATADMESEILALSFPLVKELDKPRSPEEWKSLLEKQENYWREALGLNLPKGDGRKKAMEEAVALARAELPALLGISREKVEAMCAEEAFLRWLIRKNQNLDALFGAALRLPAREALPMLAKAMNAQDGFYDKYYHKGLFGVFNNHINFYLGLRNLERRIAILRVIEAARHHAATHQGKLPLQLSDITEVPVPLDPLTDKPFVWKVEGDRATLSPPDFPPEIQKFQKVTAHPVHRQVLDQSYLLKVRTK